MILSFYTSSSEFGVKFENNLVFSEDGKHLIRVDGTDFTQVCVEDITTESNFIFGDHSDVISTLIFDQDSGTLLAGDYQGHLIQYDLDLENQISRQVRDFGELGIETVLSSFRFMGFVFFGGSRSKFRVLDLPSKEMLPGHIETGVEYILSLQISVVDKSRVFLAVLGKDYNCSSTESDLYDLGELVKNVTIPGEMIEAFEYVSVSDIKAKEAELVQAKKTISLQEDRISKLSNENKCISILEKKVVELQVKLTKKESDHEELLKKNQSLNDQNQQLQKEKVSQDNIISKLNIKISEIESKLAESKEKHKSTFK